MRTASKIIKTSDKHSEYQIFVAFPRQQWLHERALMLRYSILLTVCVFKLEYERLIHPPIQNK
jgi:hypothetical protein